MSDEPDELADLRQLAVCRSELRSSLDVLEREVTEELGRLSTQHVYLREMAQVLGLSLERVRQRAMRSNTWKVWDEDKARREQSDMLRAAGYR